ncbi:low-specificity L-threonine aldolase [Desulfogranum marinum]|uniref:low-specificity L-threonine aldolase n=1 Tax=Desulfogranum marinum TaxID=453220 RepID=UPI001965C3FB|nr:low-specificity L-threonine aldolase [Desulfogranum marinum]MBM9513625.1 low-specificity L-threonine aldolase [Desulfogranum marinum]
MDIIDLRSDTVTKPTREMRLAMAEAQVGDDVYGEDPTVNRLEALAAEMLGTESAVFAASGTQTNLLALLVHCGRGDEYIVGQQAHTYKYEGGGAAVLGSIQPQPLDFQVDGTFDLDEVARVVKPVDVHFARTRLLCLENTHNGMALPLEYQQQARECADANNLCLHLDGARLCNAAAYHKVPMDQIAASFDSISVCLSKGLGAPVGSVLCSSREVTQEARRWRKMLGGGMRQAGILAAAGVYALQHHLERVEEDHAHAKMLAQGLEAVEEIRVDFAPTQTNMVFVDLDPADAGPLQKFMRQQNILISSGNRVRLVTHLDLDGAAIASTVAAFKAYFSKERR